MGAGIFTPEPFLPQQFPESRNLIMTSSSRPSQSGKKTRKNPNNSGIKGKSLGIRAWEKKIPSLGSRGSRKLEFPRDDPGARRGRTDDFPCGFASHPRGIRSRYPDFFYLLIFRDVDVPLVDFLGFPAEFWDVNGDFFFPPGSRRT